MTIPEISQETLEAARLVAEERDLREDNTPHTVQFGGIEMQINPRRPKRGRWSLTNDNFQITIRSPKMDWCVTVRYSSYGLWCVGIDELRDQVIEALKKEFRPIGQTEMDWSRISEGHWAWDFESEDFSKEMVPGLARYLLCHSSSKKKSTSKIMVRDFGRADYLETLEVGGHGTPLHVIVYDKGKEITETSQKTWMFDLWERDSDWKRPKDGKMPKHVWRLEVRFRGEFFRSRDIQVLDEMMVWRERLLTEALFTRRLTKPGRKHDSNRSRWPMHPVWVAAWQTTDQVYKFAPLGRTFMKTADAMRTQLLKNSMGNLLAATVLNAGDWDKGSAEILIEEMIELAQSDEDLDLKVGRIQERYKSMLNDAKEIRKGANDYGE